MNEVKIHEVGLRDGLQIEKQAVPLEKKIAWIEGLLAAGIDMIQLGSFVNPERVPQMADSDKLFAHFSQEGKRPPGVVLSGLVLNERGLERGLACGVDMFCMGVSASDTHSRKNTGKGTAEAIDQIMAMAQAAMKAQKRVQASIQSAFGCGFEGPIASERVLAIVDKYLAAGIRNISLADTAGHAYPPQVETLYGEILKRDGVLDDLILESYRIATLNKWQTDLLEGIMPNTRKLIRKTVKVHKDNDCVDYDVTYWSKIDKIRKQLGQDTLEEQCLLTKISIALHTEEFEKASQLQIEMQGMIEDLQDLYSVYVRNIF